MPDMILLTDILHFPLRQPVAIFLLVVGIILLAPMLFNRLRIPSLVGLIVAGMIVGPYGFNLLERDAGFTVFGEVGILYLMFLAAVEIDMFHLRQNYKQGIIYGILSFLIPMAAGICCCRYILNLSWLTSALIASMYSSHTLISYPVVTRFGLARSRASIVAVCGTIVAVLLSLIVLAEVTSIHENGGIRFSDTAWLLIKAALYIIIFGKLAPIATRFFFRRVTDGVSTYIFVLAMIFLFSLTAELIGLAAILGAFYAGLVLNRFIPSRSLLMSRIEFVGNAIFIPYFLIGVGMLININVIVRGWDVLWVALNMITVSLISKFIAAYISGRSFKFSSTETGMMFGLSSGKAAATIAAVMIGYEYGLLDEDIMNGAVLMIFTCCLVASIVTQRAAVRMRMDLTEEELLHGERTDVELARQLVAVSNPVTASGLMKLALLMRNDRNRSPVNLLFVRNSDNKTVINMGREAMKSASSIALGMGLEVKEVERFDINVMSGLVNVMKELECTDIIIGLHRKQNVVDSFYGAMTEQLLRTTNRMIILNRCFVPANTLKRLMIFVPRNAEYETGFRLWVTRVGNLATQLGCQADFIAYRETIPYLEEILREPGFGFRFVTHELSVWDDFIVLSSQIDDDDLLIIVGARRSSISFNSDLEDMPEFLNKYYGNNNLMIIYPEQFGN